MYSTTSHFQKIPNFFPNAIECEKYSQFWNNPQTNPKYPNFKQTHFTCGDKIDFYKYRDMNNSSEKDDVNRDVNRDVNKYENLQNNIFLNIILDNSIYWIKYKNLNNISVDNTFNYIFEKFKKGIFVKIRNNVMTNFLPFSNVNFLNEWNHKIQIDPRCKNFSEFLQNISRMENKKFNNYYIQKDFKKWYANNCLLRYEFPLNEKDTNIPTTCDMFETLCETRSLPDIEIFINRRDFPLIKNDDTESYEHIYDDEKQPLLSHNYDKYAPILSMVTTNKHSDIPIPTCDDWNRICINEKFFSKSRCFEMINVTEWKNKKNTAIFRGSNTGYGVDIKTNMRLKLAWMSLNQDKKENPPLLDAGITGWNLRPRKIYKEKYLKTIDIESLNIPLVNFVTPTKQTEYKYIINVDGHVSAFRLSLELQSKSTVLIVESKYIFWYKKLLIPYVHYVPIKSDLSDLFSQIYWCRSNDEKCKQIAENAHLFYQKYLTKNGILDYLQKLLYDIKKQNGIYFYPKTNFIEYINYIHLIEKKYVKNLQKSIITNKKSPTSIPIYKNSFNFLTCIRWMINIFKIELIEVKSVNEKIKKVYFLNYPLIKKNIKDDILAYHEAFICMCLNEIIRDIPNFPYIFKIYNEKEDNSYILYENIEGIKLSDYLHNLSFKTDTLFNVLIQIILTLFTCQKQYCFMHNNLTSENVILNFLKTPIFLEYKISNIIYRLKTNVIAVIINMKKSQLIYKNKIFSLENKIFSENFDITTLFDSLEPNIPKKETELNIFFKECKKYKTCFEILEYFKYKITVFQKQTIFYDNYNSTQLFNFICSQTINEKIQSYTKIFQNILDYNFKFNNNFQKIYCIENILRNLENNFIDFEDYCKTENCKSEKDDYEKCKNKLNNLLLENYNEYNIEFKSPKKSNNFLSDIFYTQEKLKNIINEKYTLLTDDDYLFLEIYKNKSHTDIINHKIYNANIHTLRLFYFFCYRD
jgi:hypothetical protein